MTRYKRLSPKEKRNCRMRGIEAHWPKGDSYARNTKRR
jgi:hypothetical protein